MVEKDGVAFSLDWRDMDPRSLLQLHRSLIDRSGGEEKKEELLLQAMSFSWLRKFREEARGVAEEVIRIRPDFAVQWEQIMEDFGE